MIAHPLFWHFEPATVRPNKASIQPKSVSSIKPKFHYVDFARTLSRIQIMKVRDTNHVAYFHDLCRGLL